MYVAALRVGAELVFGDRPKSETFLQVAKQCSLKDLDKGFGEQVPISTSFLWLLADFSAISQSVFGNASR